MCSKKVKGEFFFFFFFFFFFSLPLYSGIEVWEGLSLGGKCNEPERLYFCLREVMERFVYLAIYSAQTLPSGGLGQMWGGHPSPGFMVANILTQHAPLTQQVSSPCSANIFCQPHPDSACAATQQVKSPCSANIFCQPRGSNLGLLHASRMR